MRKVEDRAGNQSDARRNPMDQDISELEHSRDLHNIPAVWYKAVIQSAMEGFLLANDEGKILDVNDAFCRMSGYSRGELLSIRIQDIDVEFIEAPEEFGQKVLEVKEAGGASAVKQHRCKDGRIIDVAVNAKYLDMGQGLLFCFHRDITQQKKVCQQLKESEERYRALVDLGGAVGEAVVMLQDKEQAEAVHTYVSDEWSRITGYTREELLGKSFFDFVHPEYRQASRERHSRKMAGENTPGLFEVLILRKDGAEVPLELTSAYTTYNGTRANVAYIRDITKRKRMEQALKESEERYRAIFENTGTATAIIEEDTMLSLVNTEFERLSGYSKEEVEGKKSWTEFVVKEDLDRLMEYHRLRGTDPNAAPREYVARFNDRQGNTKDIFVTVGMIPGTKRRVISLLDNTERKQAEEALLDSESRYRTLFRSAPVGIAVTTYDGSLLATNEAMLKMTGYSEAEIKQINVRDSYQNPEERGLLLKRLQTEGFVSNFETVKKRKDGTPYYASLTITPFTLGDKEVLLTVAEDITERKRLEEEIKQYQEQLEELVRIRTAELARANKMLESEVAERKLTEKELGRQEQELEAQIKQRVEFTRALVHELKTPLTAVVASSELLIETSKDELGSRLAGNIYRGALNLDKRIDELLDLAKSEVGKLRVECKSLDPLKVVNQVFDDMSAVSAKKGQSLVLAVPNSLPLVWADEERLRQILLNFVSNALKFNRKGGRIILKAEEKGGSLIFEIQDEGEGIDKGEQERLFQPYYRLERDREHLNGLGLGLALSKALVELHQGKIWVKSRKGKGSTFAFSLPIRVPAQPGSEP